MSVRAAEASDIEALVAIGERFHAMSPHRFMGEYDSSAMGRVLAFMIGSSSCAVFMNGSGVIGGTIAPLYFNPSRLMVEENFWFADRDGGQLLQSLLNWGHEMGANYLAMSTLENEKSEVIDKLMRRKGFVLLERRYLKEIA